MKGALPPFLTGLAVALVLTPLTMWIARRAGAVARPVKDRWSQRVVPLLGGVAIFAGLVAGCLLWAPASRSVQAVLAGATLLFLVGLVDDLRRLRPATKLVAQVAAASLFVALALGERFQADLDLPVALTAFWVLGIIFWLVAITNAFNLIDNMDGLCAGVGAIAGGALAAYALRYQTAPFPDVVTVSVALTGAMVGFLVFNFQPARSFMGDAGALVIGFTLAACSILGTREQAGGLFLILAVPVLVLAVPILDTTFVTIMRKLNRRKVSVGGRDHLSHRLVALGMSERRAVLVLWTVCGTLAALGVAMSYLDLFANVLLLGISFVAAIIFAIVLGEVAIYRTTKREEEGAAGEELRKTFANYFVGTSRVLLDLVLISLAYIAAYLIVFEGVIEPYDRQRLLESLPLVILAKSAVFHAFRLYRLPWRYFGVQDLLTVLNAVWAGSVACLLALVLVFRFEGYSRVLFVVDAMALLLLLAGSRFLFRALSESRHFPTRGRRTLILGGGDHGELCLRALRTREGGEWLPVGILDGRADLRGRRILGVPVLGTAEDLERVAGEKRVEEVVVACLLTEEERAELAARCETLGLDLFEAPGIRGFTSLAGAGTLEDPDAVESGS